MWFYSGWQRSHLKPQVLSAADAIAVVKLELAMNRAEKSTFVGDLNAAIKRTGVLVVAHYAGLTVAQMSNLRVLVGKAGGTVKVAKNRLTKLALDGTDMNVVTPLLKGPTVLIYSEDPVAAPKVVVDFAKDHDKLVILGGALGVSALKADGVKALATLPSLDQLRGKLLGILQAPATKVAGVIQAPAAQLARLTGAYAQKAA